MWRVARSEASPASPCVSACLTSARLPCAQTGVLGQGTFGVVVRAVDPDMSPDCPVEVAIKLLPRGEVLKNFKTYVAREILHQSCLKHPFIVSIKEVRTAVPSGYRRTGRPWTPGPHDAGAAAERGPPLCRCS